MDGRIQVIDGVYPVTIDSAIYLEGTSKTLKEAIDEGSLGDSTATTSGRGYTVLKLRGCKVIVYDIPTSASTISKVGYKFPTEDSNRERRLFVWTPSGGRKSIDIPDGTLELNQALVYNVDTNIIETRIGTWGNVPCANNELLLLYNDRGISNKVGGVLSPYIVTYEQKQMPFKELVFDTVSTIGNGLSQGIFIIDDTMYLFGHSSDDKQTLGGFNKRSIDNLNVNIAGISHDLGHMNAPSYSTERDMLIVGNGSKLYDQTSFPMSVDIFYNFKNIIENTTKLLHAELEKTVLDLSMFEGEFKAQVCWGNGDHAFLLTAESRIIRELKLGKGTTKLTNGNYTEVTEDKYNGTFDILGKWQTSSEGVIGGMIYHKGHLYVGLKGEYGIRKITLCIDGSMFIEHIKVFEQIGMMQGLEIYNGNMYAFTDSKGYMISLDDLK